MEASREPEVLETPIWMVAIRVAQVLLSLVILAMAGDLMHGAYLDEHGLCVAVGLITWLVVAYMLVSEKFVRKAYHIIAVIVLDGLMVILWLATFAATAAKRALFVVPVDVQSCVSDGSLIDSVTCARRRSLIEKRGTLLFKKGQAMMSANAGLGALVWLLFIATFSWTMVMFFRGRKEGRFLLDKEGPSYQMEAKAGTQPAPVQPQQPIQPQQTGNFEKPEGQTQYQYTGAYQEVPQAQAGVQYPQGTYSSTQSQPPYQPAVSPQPTTTSVQTNNINSQELYGQQQYPQQGYYGGSELSGSEVQNQASYYPSHTQSPPPGQQYPHPQ